MIGVVGDEATRATLSDAARQRNIPHAFEIGDIELALAAIDPDETADCVVIDLESTPDAVDDVAVLSTGLPQDAELFLLGQFTESQAYELMQAGATLCLAKPVTAAALDRIFGRPVVPAAVAPSPPERQPEPELRPLERPREAEPPAAMRAPEIRSPPAPTEPAVPRRPEREPERQEPAVEQHLPQRTAQRFNPVEAPPSYGSPPARAGGATNRVLTVVGCRGGVGASSVAVGLAWLLAEEFDRHTALLDLDPFFGSIALALNLDPGDALSQALERPSRIDAVFVERAVRKFGQRLYVLSSEQSFENSFKPDPIGPGALVRSLSARYERLVIDLPRGAPDLMMRTLSLSDEIILVTDLSLASARDAMRLMALVRGAASYARVRIVAGGARDAGKNPILSPSEFRRAVGAAIDITIGHDGETAASAARSGRPMPKVFPRSPASKALRNLAKSLESHEQREQKRGLLWWKR